MNSIAGSKPHVVSTPFPIQSHISTLMNLAKVLHSRGFHITFVNTEYNHRRLLNSRGPQALDGLPDFNFATIPDGLSPTDANATQDLPSLCDSTQKNCVLPFTELLARLHKSASNGLAPPVTCLVSDTIMTFTVKAAEEFGLPVALYCPINVVSFLGLWHSRTLLDKGIIPLKDESYLTNGYVDAEIDWLTGMKNVRLRDLPSFVRTIDPNANFMLNFSLTELQRGQTAHAIIFNTTSELESDALSTLSSISIPPIYTIGPVPLLLNQIPLNHQLESIGSNLWKEETQCIHWLDSKKPKSVVYVNFGSITVMSKEQVQEFAWGLANSKKQFLWIIRPDLLNGGSMILTSEFLTETKERGFIGSWCEQEKVLNHPSIGGFLTHCGWNMIESLCGGVPMACWPSGGDQLTNYRYACTEWRIGVEIDNNVMREVVERIVNELMEGEKGKEMRHKVLDWKKIAKEAATPGGSSYMNLEKLINQVLIEEVIVENYCVSF